MFKNKFIYPVAKGSCHPLQDKASGDINNCTIRTLANCLEIDYEEVNEAFESAGRVFREGCDFDLFYRVYKDFGFQNFSIVGKSRNADIALTQYRRIEGVYPEIENGMTVKTFLKNYPTGIYAVWVNEHIFSVIDGAIIDTSPASSTDRIHGYFTF